MTVPVIVFPNPLRMVLTLLRNHPALPATLNGKVCATLPDAFPDGCPYLQCALGAGGRRLVPLRLATAVIDLNVYDPDLYTASDLAAQVAAIALSLEQQTSDGGGFTRVVISGDPHPMQDPDTALERYVVPITLTYRPL